MKKRIVSSLGLATLVSVSLVAPASAALVFDFAADFSNTNGNPNGVWSYGYKPIVDGKPTGTFLPLNTPLDIGGAGMAWCYNNYGDGGGLVWKNQMNYGQYNISPGHVSLEGDPGYTTTARWTAPSNGYIDLAVAFGGSGAARYIMLSDTLLAEGSTDWYSYNNPNVYMNIGDTIDVTAYGAPASGNTQTDITISLTAVPEPTTLLSTLALVSSGLLLRRRTKALR